LLKTGNKRILLLFAGATSPFERGAMERETIPHPEMADKVVGGFGERNGSESLVCHRILESMFLKLLGKCLLESEIIDSEILIAIIKPLIEKLCPNSWNQLFVFSVNKGALGASV
jgi:hypothetical protein